VIQRGNLVDVGFHFLQSRTDTVEPGNVLLYLAPCSDEWDSAEIFERKLSVAALAWAAADVRFGVEPQRADC